MAAEYRDLEVIKLLLDFKADPNSKSQTGTTALHMLTIPAPFPYSYKNAPEIAKLLISKGAKMFSNESISTPLNMAMENLRILEDKSSPWKDYPFYDEMKTSIKSLIDIYSKFKRR
jgi:ankyrin repeat protein